MTQISGVVFLQSVHRKYLIQNFVTRNRQNESYF